jgi:hypothetical protein
VAFAVQDGLQEDGQHCSACCQDGGGRVVDLGPEWVHMGTAMLAFTVDVS